ncbi:MAG: DUF4386 domain-containing protein [Methanocellales archaeon]|nr:DUF4386 domain-containing protein [Methanocellales archaeon]
MKNIIAELSPRKAARIVGISFIISFVLAIYVGNFTIQNFINPGDTAALANDIKDNEILFNIAVVGYLIILALDAAIALGLYIVLKPANRMLASLSGNLRFLYVDVMVISVLALAFQFIDVYGYGTLKLIGYLFFTCHVFVTGYTVFISGYIPRIFGVLLMIAFFSYVLAFYVSFLVPEALLLIFMLFMIIGELSLSLWLLVKGAKIPEMKNQDETPA